MKRTGSASVFYAGFLIVAIAGIAWGAVDDIGSKMRVSLYGTNTVNGDFPVKVNGSGVLAIQDNGGSISIDDNGGSVTIDGTVAATQSGAWTVVNAGTFAVQASQSGSWTASVTQSGTWILGANSGIDIGDVTINNASGGSAVNIQDGGNSITVDGTVALSAGSAIIGKVAIDQTTPGTTNLVQVTDGAGALNVIVDSLPTVTVTDGAGALNVIVDSLPTVTVTDGAGALNVIIDSGTTAVTQGTAASLNATVVGTGTFATQPAGSVAHDAGASAVNPVLTGCYANAAAPADVSTDLDSVRAWCLKNGAQATVVTAAGALIGGDAANGLDVDVTRLPALVAGSAIVGKVGIDQTTPGTTNLVQITDGSGAVNVIIDSSATLTVNSHAVTVASGGVASGAVASGAFASGALASGSVASGAVASGAVASGAFASGSISAGAIVAGASSLVKNEDVLSADADAGVPAMCTRKATAANVSGSDGDYEFLQCSAGRLWTSTVIDTALPAGAALIGKVGIDQTTPGTTNAVQPVPGTNTGLSMYNVEPGASDNHAVIKAGAGNVYHIAIFTKHTAAQYFRLYDATTGFNGCNSATNLKWSGIIPSASTGAGYVEDIAMGLSFATGISICLTGAFGQTDTTNATASVTETNIGYK